MEFVWTSFFFIVYIILLRRKLSDKGGAEIMEMEGRVWIYLASISLFCFPSKVTINYREIKDVTITIAKWNRIVSR